MSWIVVPNWDKFQHYGDDRALTFIKVYVELERRDDWTHLTLAERGLLVCIWLEYAARRGQLRVSELSGFVLQKVPRRSLDSLQQAGFVEVSASKPRAHARTRSREKELEKDLPKKVSKQKSIDGRKVTGYRFVRGSHSGTYVPDPFGTDTPPYPVPKETR